MTIYRNISLRIVSGQLCFTVDICSYWTEKVKPFLLMLHLAELSMPFVSCTMLFTLTADPILHARIEHVDFVY